MCAANALHRFLLYVGWSRKVPWAALIDSATKYCLVALFTSALSRINLESKTVGMARVSSTPLPPVGVV
jgi:hypothetical protein